MLWNVSLLLWLSTISKKGQRQLSLTLSLSLPPSYASLCLCLSHSEGVVSKWRVCLLLVGCFLDTPMGAGGHQVAKTETTTPSQACLLYFNSISRSTENYGYILCFTFMTFFLPCVIMRLQGPMICHLVKSLIICYVLLFDVIKFLGPSWMFSCMFTCSRSNQCILMSPHVDEG